MVFLHSQRDENAELPEKNCSTIKNMEFMVKRKEVKIDEEQIRRVMAGDIPASVLENRYGSNAADSQKEDDKKPETENRSGIPAKSGSNPAGCGLAD